MMYIPKVYELIHKSEVNRRLRRHRHNETDEELKPWLHIEEPEKKSKH